MSQAILLCGVGSAVESVWQKTWKHLESELTKSLGLPCHTAFTSAFIRNRLAANGILGPSPEEMIETLEKQKTDIFVQPLLLSDGEEYQKLKSTAQSKNLPFGIPILADETAKNVILEKLCAEYPAEEKRHILFILHGSKISCPEDDLRDSLLPLHRSDISLTVLKKELPAFPAGTEKILLVPVMIAAGRHAVRDIVGELEPKLRSMGYTAETVVSGLAEREWFVPVITGLIRRSQ